MAKPEPTKFEIDILRALWARPGGATVRDVQDDLRREKEISFNAIGTTLRRMVDKGLVRLSDERKPQKFVATFTQDEVYGSIVATLRQRLFGGSLAKLVKHALSGARATRAEVDEVKRLLNDHERDRKR